MSMLNGCSAGYGCYVPGQQAGDCVVFFCTNACTFVLGCCQERVITTGNYHTSPTGLLWDHGAADQLWHQNMSTTTACSTLHLGHTPFELALSSVQLASLGNSYQSVPLWDLVVLRCMSKKYSKGCRKKREQARQGMC
jgi:hypothetical protein